MKSILITFDKAHYERIIAALDRLGCRCFTHLEQARGQETKIENIDLEDCLYPSTTSTIITIVENDRVESLLAVLKRIDETYDQLGLKAFVWNIEHSI